jgi:hypothetical protein
MTIYLDHDEITAISEVIGKVNDLHDEPVENRLRFEITVVDTDGTAVGYIKQHVDDPDGYYGFFPRQD